MERSFAHNKSRVSQTLLKAVDGATRFPAGLAYVGTPWAVLPIELLHGITFGCAWAAGTLYCSRIAPRGLEATTQALFNVSHMSVLHCLCL